MAKRRPFQRPLGQLPYKKLFIIAVEGNKTEVQYFNYLKNLPDLQSIAQIECLKSNHKSSPPQVLKKMLNYCKKESLKESDEAWLVVDKDQWTDQQLMQLYEWSQQAENYGFALSNPKFEYWLLLHFEDGTNINASHQCDKRLEKHFPNYEKSKSIDLRKITLEKISEAIKRAKSRDNPPCTSWPCTMGVTTVYRLIESILRSFIEKTIKKI